MSSTYYVRTQFPSSCKVARGRNDDTDHVIRKVCQKRWRVDSPNLTLDRLDQERSDVLAIEVECALETLDDAIGTRQSIRGYRELCSYWHVGEIGNSPAISPGSTHLMTSRVLPWKLPSK